MSSPIPDEVVPQSHLGEVDDPMQGSGQEEEGEGDVSMPDVTDDSSEEGEDDEEEIRRITEGFIVDEDEEEEEEEAPRKRRKRRKKHHREAETLEEDDLRLVEENAGTSFKKSRRLTRFRDRNSGSPPTASTSKRRGAVDTSEDDLDNDEDLRQAPDITNIWDDERRGDDDDEDMSDFIDYSDEEEGGVAMNEEAREARRQEKRQEQILRKKARGARPELAGIDANAWDEIHDVFGDGHEYDWALVGDDEPEYVEEQYKPDMKYQDVFEPSEIRKRMLTEDDDLIRAQDIPERMQLATSSLSPSSTLSLHTPLTEDDLGGAAMWVTQRLSSQKNRDFFSSDGVHQQLKGVLVMAVTFALRHIFIEQYEVPYIWVHKRDYISYFEDGRPRFELLSLKELWRINSLGQKYRSLLERQKALATSYERLQVKDEYYEDEISQQIDSVEVVADATEWLSMKYKDKKQDTAPEFRFHDDEDPEVNKKRKMPSRISAYEVTKKSIISKLAQGFGIQPHQVVLNFLASHHVHFVDDQEFNPLAYAEQFEDSDPVKGQSPEELLRKARMILSTELGKDPLLRSQMRKLFKGESRVTVEPTERGITKIDENHPYFNFKYLYQKPINEMLVSGQFLHILAAEAEHLITISVFIPQEVKSVFERKLLDAFSSDSFSEAAKAWNAERLRVVQEVIEQHLIPAGIKWTREYIREDVEDFLAERCSDRLQSRIDMASYLTRELKYGEFASSVLAISWGKGDPHKDPITLVFVDEAGRMREHTKIDNLYDADNIDEFKDLLKRRKPDVAVVGGFTVATLKLMNRVKELFRGSSAAGQDEHGWSNPSDQGWGNSNEQAFDIPAIYVHDDVARIYQHSKRAADEFSALPPNAKYCVGLARYVQSPLNEFAALGSDITAISLDEDHQHLVYTYPFCIHLFNAVIEQIPKDKLLTAFEQVLVDITNKVGVDINRAVADPYYQHLLPFICGLGPRKAQVLVKKITSQGGTLVNRDQFIKGGLLTTKIFLNAAGFLRIIQDRDTKPGKYRPDDENAPDPLDDTRIHPEDYELARKMATDALELDEEDIHDEHPSQVVNLVMSDKDKERKLLELNLDEFAISLFEANHDQKRHTLNIIREELLKPFAEKREKFKLPDNWGILTMLSGETLKTLQVGIILSALVFRIQKDFITVRLDSGIECTIQPGHLADNIRKPSEAFKKGQTVTGIVVEMKLDFDHDELYIGLSTRPQDLKEGDRIFRRVQFDEAWDHARFTKDQEMMDRKKRAETDRSRRVIKHPNFHNFNTAQAETYLEKQQRGDVVIRPSSKGINHLAVTWKVDEKLYQHIDVTELNADPTGQTVGGQLIVDPTHSYADLDELIVNHVQAMARRVEELMAHEKFKHGSEDELHLFLKNFLAANPAKSMYGFTLNRKRPGHFNLCFLANKNSIVQTWPIRVAPEAYFLFEAAAVGVPELCDAFKVRHLHESQNLAAAAAGGKTPFGAGARTPARPGGATPGHMSTRQVGRTPNPYGGGAQTPFVPTGPPNYGMPSNGYQTPSHRQPFPGQPPTMPPNLNATRPPTTVWNQSWS